MKITIDASPLLGPTETGGARYTRKLLEGIAALMPAGERALFFHTFNPAARKYYGIKNPDFVRMGFSCVSTSFPRYGLEILWDKLGVNYPPIEFLSGDADVFHSVSYRSPVTRRAKLAVTLFDLTVIKNPLLYPDSVEPFRKWVLKSAERADKIITISESSKNDIVELLRVPKEKVAVTYLAPDERCRPIDDKEKIDAALRGYGISYPYILYVGTLGRNKNLPVLVRAFKMFKDRIKSSHKLVIAGASAWKSEEITGAIDECGLGTHVIMPGYVPEEILPLLYNGCQMFAYVSLYEGFGLPPLEAMSCGKPVIVSRTSSLPEVTGDAGLGVDPENAEEIADAMYKIASDPDLRVVLSGKSVSRAGEFSWRKCAADTMEVYRSLCR
ncbi:MAG: glycosyltransferase family 1 protein [Endomicrobiia bacterium]|nr:glycosyltransferase family 1 protein [Endomicrobiia bacterium]